MTSSRPTAATPERRQSRIFTTLGFTPRMKSFSPSSPATNATQRRLLECARRNERQDLSELLACLESDSSNRHKAVPILTLYIRDFVLGDSEISIIFQALLRLLTSHNHELVDCAFSLFHHLLREQRVLQSLRIELVHAIMALSDDEHLAQKPKCLADATDDGKNIDGLENEILHQTCSVASLCFHRFIEKSKDPDTLDEYKQTWNAAFLQSIRLLSNTIRFGPSIGDAWHVHVIDETRRMIYEIETSEELLELLRIFDAFIFRGDLPPSCLLPVMETLCVVHATRAGRNDTPVLNKTAETFQWLCQTYAQSTLVHKMITILQSSSDNVKDDLRLETGSLQLLIEIMTEPILSRDADIEFDDVLAFLRRISYDNQPELLRTACSFICVLVNTEALLGRLVAEDDWENLSQAILAIYLALLKTGAEEDLQVHIGEAVTKLDGADRTSLQQKHHLSQLGLYIGQYLPAETSERLLSNYTRPLDPTEMHRELTLLCTNYVDAPDVAPQLQLTATEIVQKLILGLQQSEADLARQCIASILDALASGNLDTHIQSRLVGIVVEYITLSSDVDDEFFESIVDKLSTAVRAYYTPAVSTLTKQRTARPIALALVLLFMRCINVCANRSQFLMKTMMGLLNFGQIDPSATVMLLRATFRLRSDIGHRIFLVASQEGEGLAATLSRSSTAQPDIARRGSKASSLSETGPVWKYGEIQGLPEDPPTTASKVLSSMAKPSDGAGSLDMAAWLAYATSIIDNGADWEVFSYTIVHLGAQLTNQTLFMEGIPQLRDLRSLLCRQLLRQTVLRPPEATELKQSDVAVCLYNILTTLIGYHEHFSRAENEELISAFIMGLTAWDRTTVPCIHALTLCCYELPDFLKRDLVRIVSQMASIVTKSEATVHVLEFLAGLSRLSDLARTFRGEEIKVVFGVCFSYIDYVRGRRLDDTQRAKTSSVRSTERPIEAPTAAEEIGEYVFALAYYVITFWCLTLQRSDREQYYPWMQQRLLSTDAQGKREQQALVTLDFIWRLTYREQSDVSLLRPEPMTKAATSVISQYSLMTIDRGEAGKGARIIDRRASGTDEWIIEEPSDLSDKDLLQTQILAATQEPFPDASSPVSFDMSDAALRSIDLFDRSSPIDFFKAGVLYVGEDQFTEEAILSNMRGSPDYLAMLSDLGSRLPLLGLRHNSCGLDTSEALFDGPYTIWHHDAVTALILHIPSFMPPDPSGDARSTRKKSHVGNDFVTVVFNNSAAPWRLDTLPSDFNYVHVVVSPEARSSFIETRTGVDHDDAWFRAQWFKVQIVTRADFPNLGSAAQAKVVSGKALGLYVRNLVLNACIFAQVWQLRQGAGLLLGGTWQQRLGSLTRLLDRYGKTDEDKKAKK